MTSKRARENRYRKTSGGASASTARRWPVALLKVFAGAAVIAAMSLVFVFGHDWLTQCDYFRADTVEVSGGGKMTRKQILETAGIEEGVNILSVNLGTVRKRLLALPWVAEAEVARDFPETLIVRIREHSPVAVIKLGKPFLINSEGEIFMETQKESFPELPVITGADYQDWKADKSGGAPVSESVVAVLRRGRQKDSAVPNSKIRQIDVDRDLGLTLITEEEFPAELILLGYGGYETKYRRLSKVFSYLERSAADERFEEIDLSCPDRIVAKPAEEDETHLNKLQKEA